MHVPAVDLRPALAASASGHAAQAIPLVHRANFRVSRTQCLHLRRQPLSQRKCRVVRVSAAVEAPPSPEQAKDQPKRGRREEAILFQGT